MAPSKDSVVADHVIVDSAGFINNAPINDLSENVYCISEVVSEIRDKATKQRLQVLPYTINFREPSSESISVVNTFAKKTGDYRSLSRTDIKLIALTYQLQKEKAGVSHLRTSPLCRPESVVIPTKKSEQQDAHIAGFYLGDLKTGENTSEKKKVVDDLINSLEKLKVAVQEVKTDFTLSPRDPVDPSSLTSNETVYGSFNYWRNPLPEFELFQELESCSPLFGVNRSSDRKPSLSKPPLPPKPFCLTSPTKSHPDPLSPLLIPPPKSVGLTANQNGVSHEIVTSPDFDDFLFWKSDICLSPEEIHYELVSGGELEKADEEKEVTSWGDAGRIARQNGDVAVMQDKHDLQSLLEGRVVQGGDEDTSDEEEEEDLVDFDSSGFGGGSESSGLGGGWITPKNLAAVKQEQTGGGADQDQTSVPVAVACLTTDFAMQNVLIQMGLNVIGVNGKVIKRARSYALRCYGCFKLTFNLEKQFCPHCGNQTLKRVSIKVNDDGSLQYFISLRKPISAKGKNKSLPPPKGGKHSTDPIVFEDQRVPHNRASKMATQSNLDAFDADFVARDSPFAVNDVNSRAAMMGINRRSSGGGGGGARGNRKRRR